METMLVQVPSPDGAPSQVVHVGPAETLSFGRGAAHPAGAHAGRCAAR